MADFEPTRRQSQFWRCRVSIAPSRILQTLRFGLVGFSAALQILFAASASRADQLVELERQVERMEIWLASSPNGTGWRTHLDLPELEKQLVLGYRAEVHKLREIRQRFSQPIDGLKHPIFVSVAESLERFVNRLETLKSGEDLQASLEQLKVRPFSAAELNLARSKCLRELRLLEIYYKQTQPDRAQRVIDGLQIQQMRSSIGRELDFSAEPGSAAERQLSDDVRGLVQLGLILWDDPRRNNDARFQFSETALQLNDPFYAIAFDAIQTYSKMAFHNFLYRTESTLEVLQTRSDLARKFAIDRMQDSSLRSADQIASRLFNTDQTDALQRALYENSYPNLRISVSERLANKLGRQPVARPQPVDENILGRQVNGQAMTRGAVNIDFVHDPRVAHVSIQLLGQLTSDSYTSQGRITAFTKTYADIEARRSLLASISGLQGFQSYVAANLRSQFSGTSSRFRIVDRIANRLYQRDKVDSERVGAYLAERRLKSQFDEQTTPVIQNGKRSMYEGRQQLLATLDDYELFLRDQVVMAFTSFDNEASIEEIEASEKLGFLHANRFRLKKPRFWFHTTDNSFEIYSRAADSDQTAAESQPPAAGFQADVMVRVHESYVSNLLSNFVKNDTYRSEDIPGIIRAVAEATGAEPPAIDLGNRDWTLKFSAGRPLAVRFDRDKIQLVLTAENFNSGGNAAPIQVVQDFELVRGAPLRIRSVGQPEVLINKAGDTGAEDTSIKSLMNSMIESAMEESATQEIDIELPPNLIPERLLQQLENPNLANQIQLVGLGDGSTGWLTIGWNYNGPPLQLDANQN